MGIGEYIETGFREISFTIDPASMDGAEMAAIDGVVFTGQQLRPAIAVTLNGKRLVEDTDYKMSYANNRDAGLATATATGTGNYRGTVSRQFQILPANMADVTVDVIPDQMYIGKALTPAITAKLGGNVLIENTDYTLSYRDNEAIGTATVELTGFGNIEGMREAHFSIMPASLSAATVSGIESKAFTGKPITQPKLTVSINGTTLTPNADYSVSYRNNTNVGTATVAINGLGLLAGTSIEKTFEIVKAANPLTIKAKTAKVAYGKLAKKARTLKATKVIKFIAKGQGAMTYKLVSAKKGKKSFKKSFKINKSKGTLTLKKGLGKGTYKVKVKVKAAGNASYQASAWKAITFTVRVK